MMGKCEIILLITNLIIISVLDIRFYKIPNILVILIFAVSLVFSIYKGRFNFYTLLFSVAVFVLFYLISYFTNSLGMGDVKLLSALSFSLGFFPFSLMLVFSSLLALIVFIFLRVIKKDVKKLPFAPFISIGSLLSIFVGCRV